MPETRRLNFTQHDIVFWNLSFKGIGIPKEKHQKN